MSLPRKQIEQIEKLLRRVTGDEPPAQLAVLRHVVEGKQAGTVGRWSLLAAVDVTQHQALATEIVTAAQQDAEAAGGKQEYICVVTAGDGVDAEVLGRARFAVHGINTETAFELRDQGAVSEPPTDRGVVQMLMRQNEAKDKALVQVFGSTLGYVTRLVESQREEIEIYKADHMNALNLIRDLTLAERTAKREDEQFEREQNRLDEAMNQGFPLLKTALTYLAASKGGPAGKLVAAAERVKVVADHFTPEDIAAMGATLPPAKRAALNAFYESALEQSIADKSDKSEGEEGNGIDEHH